MNIVYEDNHIIVVDKAPGEIVQGDKTGDTPLVETVRQYIKERYNKPGNVFCGVVHRLDRPVGGLVIFAKTSKALSRLNEMLRLGQIHKTYRALTRNMPDPTEGRIESYITSVERNNKSYSWPAPRDGAKKSSLTYRVTGCTDRFNLLEINLETGRKHQIRVQLASIGCPIRGDLKYGDKRSNPDGSISLQAFRLQFVHPVSKQPVDLTAPYPESWPALSDGAAD
ncbi:MAG: RNA pseudouridine synthase [Candidatus Amulumruptor sp.]|nr:RNA pseudouridine synthase [Candidatus Amulumruptor sp.]MDE7236494.1 RNA pseudouridine synthase [Paramuribaculum sp.]